MGKIVCMLNVGGCVAGNPWASRTVAAFAANAVGDLVSGISPFSYRIVGVAIKTFFGLVGWFGKTQLAGDTARSVV